ncbi:MAG: squalene--hopene cyclase [Alphaproteobacteria bacterium]
MSVLNINLDQAPSADALAAVDELVADARVALKACPRSDGHWTFVLEADVSISAEYIFLQHFLDEVDAEEERLVARYLRAAQAPNGGWPLFANGAFDMSASVKAYYALKLAGDDPEAPHMHRARQAILAHGGAARSNVFTRFSLALFGQVPWRALPVMPAEIMLLPRWFPFHLSKVAYWSRTVIVPLLILGALRPRARNACRIGIPELFTTPPDDEHGYIVNSTGTLLGRLLVWFDALLRVAERRSPRFLRQRAIRSAIEFMRPRLNREEGLGGIFPAMANAVMALDSIGLPPGHPELVDAKRAVKRLLVRRQDHAFCQPCLSPVWDTALSLHALLEAGEPAHGQTILSACDWLLEREITQVVGDWATRRPGLLPSGWAFQYQNDHYTDVDDTAVVVMALHRADSHRHRGAIERATQWILGMQSKNGGWGAFDADNTHYRLKNIPFADHGALLDPPTADVTARCLGMLAQQGFEPTHPAIRRGIAFLEREQEPDGSWFGRWGVNYLYGTWSVLIALNALGEDLRAPYVRKSVDWLIARQGADGGWGEGCASYWRERRFEATESTASQTAWALLGLMAAGEVESEAVARGVAYLQALPREGANWHDALWTGAGFPRIFYLKYHGYSAYFPLLALARYRNLMRGTERRLRYGL